MCWSDNNRYVGLLSFLVSIFRSYCNHELSFLSLFLLLNYLSISDYCCFSYSYLLPPSLYNSQQCHYSSVFSSGYSQSLLSLYIIFLSLYSFCHTLFFSFSSFVSPPSSFSCLLHVLATLLFLSLLHVSTHIFLHSLLPIPLLSLYLSMVLTSHSHTLILIPLIFCLFLCFPFDPFLPFSQSTCFSVFILFLFPLLHHCFHLCLFPSLCLPLLLYLMSCFSLSLSPSLLSLAPTIIDFSFPHPLLQRPTLPLCCTLQQ